MNSSSLGWKGAFSFGALQERHLYRFTGIMHSSSLLSWDEIDINENNFRSISPNDRSHGIGAYGQNSMMNINSFRGSNDRIASWGYNYTNSGQIGSASKAQISSLDIRPSIFWNTHSRDYSSSDSAGAFTNQNNSNQYSIWRLSNDSDIIVDIAGGNSGVMMWLNYNTDWDDQLFAVNGQEKGNTTNGSSFSKMTVSPSLTDFTSSRPLLMSLDGGLPRRGGDVVSKDEPSDAYNRAADYDYYLNYYPNYDGTSKKLLAKDDGSDWYSLISRPQIDGTLPLSSLSAIAVSAMSGYSRVV